MRTRTLVSHQRYFGMHPVALRHAAERVLLRIAGLPPDRAHVSVQRLRHTRRDYVLVAAAGPASNLTLAVVAALMLKLLPVSPVTLGEPNVTVPIASMLSRALYINVLLAVFNMIPIPPLDGGNVIGGLLPKPLAYRFDSLIRPYGFVLLYALMLTRGLDYLIGRPSSFILSLLQ